MLAAYFVRSGLLSTTLLRDLCVVESEKVNKIIVRSKPGLGEKGPVSV